MHTFLKKASMERKSFFTLIELLVVIAIIAILAAMLLPALQQARERGKTASCVSKVKTFSTAVLFYCETFKDFMPPPSGYAVDNNGAPAASGNSFWHAAFAALKLVNTDIPSTTLAPRGLFACPSETNGRLGFKADGTTASVGNTFKGCHFGLNRYLVMQYTKSSTSTSRFVWRKITQVRRPSVTSSVGDKWMHPARTSGYAQTEINAKNRYPGERHLGSWNVATLDGSVKTMKDYPLKGQEHDYKDWFWAPTAWE